MDAGIATFLAAAIAAVATLLVAFGKPLVTQWRALKGARRSLVMVVSGLLIGTVLSNVVPVQFQFPAYLVLFCLIIIVALLFAKPPPQIKLRHLPPRS